MPGKVRAATPVATVMIVGGRERSPALADLLRRRKQPDGVGIGFSDREATETIVRIRPDLVLVDLPAVTKRLLDFIKQINALNGGFRILAICGRCDARSANRVLLAGSNGCIFGDERADELENAICDVLDGNLYLSESLLSPVSGDTAKAAPKRRKGHFRTRLSRTSSVRDLIICSS